MYIVLDIVALVIIVSSVLYGWRKGLILTVAGIVITVVSIGAAWGIATAFTPVVSNVLEDNLAPTINEVLNAAAVGNDMLPDMSALSGEKLSAATQEAVKNLGFSGGEDNVIVSAITNKVQEAGVSLRTAMISTLCRTVAFSGLFIFGFILLRAALEFAAHFTSRMFRLPGLNLLDTLGGIGAGLLHGILLLFIIGWALQFAGVFISSEEIGKTLVIRHFTDSGLLDGLSKSLANKI
ncbi:MAG: hypothetical protein LBC82_03895 [Oscillospiraceae bacterium]|jgi:uncharacterized membrane protein required for colicin V production|nr:hypothetical protein [Oscillospiraceae bacterium]